MYVIEARNVNHAFHQGIRLIKDEGLEIPSRNGTTLEVPAPVSTVFHNPWERVLINSVRDANPFFHLMESIWILAGREDVKFLTEFNKRMADYSDDGQVFNAPYGKRIRSHFGYMNNQGHWAIDDQLKDQFGYTDNQGLRVINDQLKNVISILKLDPMSRQAVCQIWDQEDLTKDTKDKACNMSLVFRVRQGKLYLTVYNRSNDMIWGAYGANSVQFSMILEYVAAHLNMPMGEYTHVSNSYHVYTEGPGGDVWNRVKNNDKESTKNFYSGINRLVIMTNSDIKSFDHDLKQFFNIYDKYGIKELGDTTYWESDYFRDLVMPVLSVFLIHKNGGKAIDHTDAIVAEDWRMGCMNWLINREKSRKAKEVKL